MFNQNNLWFLQKHPMEIIQIQYYQSPCGELILGSYGEKLCLCDWKLEHRRITIDKRMQKLWNARYETKESEVTQRAAAQLDEYFGRKRTIFDIPLLFSGTDFQKTVWNELLNIPYGTTLSYLKLAERIGNTKAVRAVACANGANPISIFVPCHRVIGSNPKVVIESNQKRVIGSNQKLVGYAGGLAAKKFLLELESGSIPWT